jgi:hypothetical protein
MVWGLPQAGILANKCLCCKLAPFGYYEHTYTPGLWFHESRPISFMLVVNDFGIKYVNKDDADHLIKSIHSTYTVTEDWSSDLYCGISLAWDHCQDISKRNFKNISTWLRKRAKHVLIRLLRNSTDQKHKRRYLPTTHRSLTKPALSACNRSLAAYYNMHGRLI